MSAPWWKFGRREDELAEELESHIAMAIRERVARGESLEGAATAARREFGNREVVRATTRDTWGWMWLEQFTLDLRFAFRSLRAAPGFLVKAALSVGVGLGLATSMFVLVDAILYPAVPYGRTDRLSFVDLNAPAARPERLPSLGEQLRALRGMQGTALVGAASAITGYMDVAGTTRQSTADLVSADFLDLLDLRPRLGRFPTQDETRAASAVVVTDAFWRRRFENRPVIGDARVTFDDHDYAVVGVMPVGADRDARAGVWIPVPSDAAFDTIKAGSIGIRLATGVPASSLAPQLATVAARLGKTSGIRAAGFFTRPAEQRAHGATDGELFLFGAAFVVFAIACTNVAVLMLVRGSSRRRDYALRRAIGATSLRIARDVFAEVLVIATLGVLAGAAVVQMSLGLLRTIVPEQMIVAGIRPPEWSTQVFVFLAGGLVTALALAGALPAWRASRTNPSDLIKSNAGTTTERSTKQFRYFIIAELALSMVLLVTAATMTHAAIKFTQWDYGFEPRPLLRAEITLPRLADSLNAESRAALQRVVLTRMLSARGVTAAASFWKGRPESSRITSDALSTGGAALTQQSYLEVSPGFFATTGIPIVSGRDLTEGDRAIGGAVILSRSLANSLFPGGNALGRRVKLGPPQSKSGWISVVGISGDVAMERPLRLTAQPEPAMFALTTNPAPSAWSLAVRPARGSDRADVVTSRLLRDALPPRVKWTVGRWLDNADAAESALAFVAQTFGIFGACAVLLAGFGLYGVVSHSVAQRTREFGVRIALGATSRQILQNVMLFGGELMIAGSIIGILLSFWSVSVFRSIMFGLGPADPFSMELAAVTMVLATVVACFAPAVHATRSDPLEILRAS